MMPFKVAFRRAFLLISAILLFSTIFLTACSSQAAKPLPKHGGSVTVVPSPLGKFQCTFNPFTVTNTQTINCSGVRGLIYEPLLYTNRLSGTTTSWLAERYEWSADAKVLTFHLQKHVTWSDGQPFTSDDVAFTYNIFKRFPALDKNHLWQQLQSISTPDAATVVMTFNSPALLMLWPLATLTDIVPQHVWKDMTDPAMTLDHPIGTGPFILNEYSPDLYVMKRNPTYWQSGKPYVDEVRFPAYDSNTGASVLLSQGKLDLAGVYAVSIKESYVDLDPTHNHYWFTPSGMLALYPNLTRAPFQSLPVRQAISLALDRDTIAQKGESGYTTAASPTGIVLPGYQPYVASQYTNLAYHQDIQQAKSLLASAGYTVGSDGIFADPSGNRLAFKLIVVDGWTDWMADADLVASQLKAVNIQVDVQRLAYSDYNAQLKGGMYDMAIFSTNGPDPYSLFSNLLASWQSAPIGQQAITNVERWIDPATDDLLKRYQESTSPDDQRKCAMGLEKIMVEQLPVLLLVYNPFWYEYSTARFVGWPDKDNPYAAPAPYLYPDIEVILLNIHLP
jgi:peptide/nickel transport system substrate-binding protein